jgi:hypothetical protein
MNKKVLNAVWWITVLSSASLILYLLGQLRLYHRVSIDLEAIGICLYAISLAIYIYQLHQEKSIKKKARKRAILL